MELLRSSDPTQIGPYTLTHRIGGGGMGTVFYGHNGQRWAAVKAINASFAYDFEYRARFRREIEAASAVDSPFTAKVFEHGSDQGVLWYASEYIKGETLEELATKRPLNQSEAIIFAWCMYGALVAIHQAGVVHRDIKPANVIVGPSGVKVVDFGIATRPEDTSLTRTGMVIGSLNYMAPERLKGAQPDAASDYFAFGKMLAFALTGRSELSSYGSVQAALDAITVKASLMPLAFRQLIAVCLQADPAKRADQKAVFTLLAALPVIHRETVRSTLVVHCDVATKVTLLATQVMPELAPTRVIPDPAPTRIMTELHNAARRPPRTTTRWRQFAYTRVLVRATLLDLIIAWVALAVAFLNAHETISADELNLPKPAFTVGALGTAKAGSQSITVTSAQADGYALRLSVRLKGYGSQQLAVNALRQSCIYVAYNSEKWITWSGAAFSAEATSASGEIVGTFTRQEVLAIPGEVGFLMSCSTERLTGGVPIGKNKIDVVGLFNGTYAISSVLYAQHNNDGDTQVVVYGESRHAKLCLTVDGGVQFTPSASQLVKAGSSTFARFTFPTSSPGTLSARCSDSEGGVAIS